MSFGDSPFGSAPFGVTLGTTSDRVAAVAPVAAYFDPFLREYTYNTDGAVLSVHPIDQKVGHILGIAEGSLRYDPTVGLDLLRIKNASANSLEAVIADEVAKKLQSLTRSGDVTIVGTPFHPTAKGRPIFYVDYINNRLPNSGARRRLVQGFS